MGLTTEYNINPDLEFNVGKTSLAYVIRWLLYEVDFWRVLSCVFVSGIIIILYQVIIGLMVLGPKLIQWLSRRVVEYNKGAVAAITLLITFVLGVIEVVMKSK